jgi:hypothetical protein
VPTGLFDFPREPVEGDPLDVSAFVPGAGTNKAPQKTDWKKLAPLLALLPAVLA